MFQIQTSSLDLLKKVLGKSSKKYYPPFSGAMLVSRRVSLNGGEFNGDESHGAIRKKITLDKSMFFF